MTRSLPVVMAMLLLGACASAPVDESAAPFTGGIYHFATSDDPAPQSTSVSYDCSSGQCYSTGTSRPTRRVRGTVVLAADGSIRLEPASNRCTSPSPKSWRDEDIRFITFMCGDLRVTLNSSRGTALYTAERRSTVRGNCARYRIDVQGRRTSFCEAYHTRTVTTRETVQVALDVERIQVE